MRRLKKIKTFGQKPAAKAKGPKTLLLAPRLLTLDSRRRGHSDEKSVILICHATDTMLGQTEFVALVEIGEKDFMKLKATESTAVRLFASYRRKGMEEEKAMAIVGASLQIARQEIAELLASLDLLDTVPFAAAAPVTDMSEVDIAEGLNALSNEGPRQLGDGRINLKDILEEFPDTESNV